MRQCNATYHALDKAGIDKAEDARARGQVMSLGYLHAPVVVAGDDHWAGFRPDRIKNPVERTVSAAGRMEDAS